MDLDVSSRTNSRYSYPLLSRNTTETYLSGGSKLAYMKLNERIFSRRKELGLSQNDVADAVGVNRVSVSNWETDGKNGTSPKGRNLLLLAKALKCNPDWLITGEGTSEEAHHGVSDINSVYSVGRFDLWDGTTELGEDEVEIPFFKEVELSAGNGSSVVKENTGFKLRFAKSTLKRQGVSPEHAACVVVSGNSMQPVLPDKATVGIDTANTKVKDGEMYAVDHDGLLRVKILYRLPGGGYRLRSYNKDEYPDEDIPGHQADKLKVLGKVFWYSVLI